MKTIVHAALALSVFAMAEVVNAQGTLSTQGFGYPPGALSTRARATGGGMTEFDPDSPVNPAAIATSSDPRLFLQYEPEFRTITNGASTSKATTARFPVVAGSVPLGSKGSVGFSASTLLDRSSSTKFVHDEEIAGTLTTITETTTALGSI